MKENRNIPLKNYIILSIILIVSVILVIYFYMWYGELETNRLNTPVIDQYISLINYNEIDTYIVENKKAFIYVSVLNNEKTRNFEKKFIKIINKYSLNNRILYLNLTDQYKNNVLFNNIVNKYNLSDLPCIVIFENGIVKDVYNIKNYNYDIELLVSYLKIKGVIYD